MQSIMKEKHNNDDDDEKKKKCEGNQYSIYQIFVNGMNDSDQTDRQIK